MTTVPVEPANPGPLGACRGFTLVEVMVAVAIFAIAFCGLNALLMVQIKEDIDSQNEMAIAARARHEIETIRSLADSKPPSLINPDDRPGIREVLKYYAPTSENASNTHFSMTLPSVAEADRPTGQVLVYINEKAVPSYFTSIGEYGTVTLDLSDVHQTNVVDWDLNQNGRIDTTIQNTNTLKILPVEVVIDYKDTYNGDRQYRLATIITH